MSPEGGAPAGAADLTAASVAGEWNASVSGQSCKVATPQTKFGSGFRAGPLHCPAPIDGIKSWNVAGKQLTLYDENGGTLARLYSSGGEKFDGQTSNGLPDLAYKIVKSARFICFYAIPDGKPRYTLFLELLETT